MNLEPQTYIDVMIEITRRVERIFRNANEDGLERIQEDVIDLVMYYRNKGAFMGYAQGKGESNERNT